MKWIIKNPAPTKAHKHWGDYHIGRCLSKYLKRLGQKVETHYYRDWKKDEKADVVLVLRGKFKYKPKKNARLNIMWNFGHPEDVSLKEYKLYDIIFVASNSYAKTLKKKINKPVYPLLLCTDPEEFYIKDKKNDMKRKDFVFVGSTRGVERPCILWAAEYGIPLKIWGKGWEKWIDKKYIVDEYIPNSKLPELYSKSKATFNNHWPDMLKYGFINNRVFDALACGLPIISDYSKELYSLFPNEVLYYRNKKEFINRIDEINSNYQKVKERVNKAIPRIRKEFSYESRAKTLLMTVKKHLKTKN
jgi:spore maturation protein CgeB